MALIPIYKKALKLNSSTAIQGSTLEKSLFYTGYDCALIIRIYVDIDTADGSVIWGGNDDSGVPFNAVTLRTYNNKIRFTFYKGPGGTTYNRDYTITESGVYSVGIQILDDNLLGYMVVNGVTVHDDINYSPYSIPIATSIGAYAQYSGNGGYGSPPFTEYNNQYVLEILQRSIGKISKEDLELATSTLDLFNTQPNFSTWINSNYAYYCDFTKESLVTEEKDGNGFLTVKEGIAQYESVVVGYESIPGELFKREETKTIEATDNYKWLISDWVYGGEMEITVNNSAIKTITTSIYDVKEERYFPIDTQTTTSQTITVPLRNYEARNMLIIVESDSNFSVLSYKIEHITPITIHNDSLQTNMALNDLHVIYPRNQFLHKSVTAKVAKEYSNLFKTITENKLYFQEKEWIVTMSSMQPVFDLNDYYFNLNLVRLL